MPKQGGAYTSFPKKTNTTNVPLLRRLERAAGTGKLLVGSTGLPHKQTLARSPGETGSGYVPPAAAAATRTWTQGIPLWDLN